MTAAELPVCARCGKKCYPSRDEARAAARRLYPDDRKLRAYRCGRAYHFGHVDVWRRNRAHAW